MILKSWFGRGLAWKIGGCVALVTVLSIGISENVLAQIVPDKTLGVEGSVVKPNVNIQGIPSDRIDGGATRGANLFHSFQELNVGEGRGVYFANPTGIENILTRVTGSNASNILGRLGVLGEANLFLLNPNGIVFGPNASLDIQGSFVATTADRLQLGDSGYFSATQPQTSSLLSVTPGALFFSQVANQPTAIINQGNLSTGKHLTLSAGNLDLQGQLLSGEDLKLQAQDRVKVRDSVTTPFLAESGRNLTVIGNGGIDILALNHPTQTPFVSGGNLSLVSDGIISGDARFSSGGSFSIKSVSGRLANFVSLYDPIISANGNVDVAANYTGASLLVEATGNIRFQGNINITRPDISTLPPIPDTAILSTTSALIMRSGQSTLAYGGVNSGTVPADNTGSVPGGITLDENVTLQRFNGAGAIVNLTAATPLGDINIHGITTNGGAIDIDSAGIITTQGLDTSNGSNDGGAITLETNNGNITTGGLVSRSYSTSGSVRNGGKIDLQANGNISTGNLDSTSYSEKGSSANGGEISLNSAKGDIETATLNSGAYSKSESGDAGQGGVINLTAGNNIKIGGDLASVSRALNNSTNGGAISLFAGNGINITGNSYAYSLSEHGTEHGTAGDGGRISLVTNNSNISTGNLSSDSRSVNGSAANGGVINISATNGSISTGFLLSSSNSDFGVGANGGAITLKAANDIKVGGDLNSLSYSPSNTTGSGGAIALSSDGNIVTTGSIISEASGSGNGGDITLTSNNGAIDTKEGTVTSQIRDNSGGTGNGGAIVFKAKGDIETATLNSSAESGNGSLIHLTNINGNIDTTRGILFSDSRSGNGGEIRLEAPKSNITTGDLISYSRSSSGNTGNGGKIGLQANGNISTGNLDSTSYSEKGSSANGGEISLNSAKGDIETATLNSGAYSKSESGDAGQGGVINLTAGNNIKIGGDLASVSRALNNSTNGGAISLFAGNGINITGNSYAYSLSEHGTEHGTAGDGGRISLVTNNSNISTGNLSSDSRSVNGSAANGGVINISATNGSISTGFLLSSSNSDFGVGANGGAITLKAANDIKVGGDLNSLSYSPSNTTGSGGAIALSSDGNIVTTGSIISEASGSGNGGDITLTSNNGAIDTKEGTVTSQIRDNSGGTGNGGAIVFKAKGDIETATLNSSAESGNGSLIHLTNINGNIDTTRGILFSDSRSGNGGEIRLEAPKSNITTGDLISYSRSSSGNTGNGGKIGLQANGNILTGNLDSTSYSEKGSSANGGEISLNSAKGDIETATLNSGAYSKSESSDAGQGGVINLTAGNNIKIGGDLASVSRALNNSTNGGAISLFAGNGINITGNSYAYSLSEHGTEHGTAGDGGRISLVTDNSNISTGNLSSDSRSVNGSAANGGVINISATNGSISTGFLLSSSNSDFGVGANGGAITLKAANDIKVGDSLYSFSYSQLGTAGQGGAISFITTGGDISEIENQSRVVGSFSISKQGTAGNGGNVTLKAKNNVSNLEILTLSSESQSGTVQVTGLGDLLLKNTNILTSKQVIVPKPFEPDEFITLNVGGKGQSGKVDVTNSGNLTFNNSSIQSDSKGSDQAGNVTVSSPGLVTFNNSFIRSNTSNSGAAGSIGIEAGQGITLVGSDSELFAGTTNIGKAGDITLTTPELTLQNGTKIATTTESSSAAGNITLQSHSNGENLNIKLAPETSISASSSNQGIGGNIEIKAPNAITIQGQSNITTETTGAGNAGKIKVTSRNLDIQQTELSTSTTGSGNAGDITLDTSTLTVAGGAKVLALTSGLGNSGTITANASSRMNLGIGVEDFSPVLSVETSSAGQPGNIIINTPSLTLSNTAHITATATNTATNPQGGGSITLNASTMDLAGVVGVFAETQGQTPAGTLTLKPYENQSTLNLTLAPLSLVSASTNGSGKGGNLIVQAPEAITIQGPGTLAVKTTGDGAAGNLSIDTQKLTIADRATISASTSSKKPEGTGGSIIINATESFNLTNASLRAESTGAAPAGKVMITTPNLTATNGTIATTSKESSGGGITITSDKIHLFGNSDITTYVNQGGGEGGKIDLKAGFIVAFDDSDILAFARDGKGGDITFDTKAFLGENYSPASSRNDPLNTLDGNNRVDVNATGAINGVITIPDVSFIQNSLTELPENQINTDSLLANSCIVRRNQPTRGSFTITGTGGLPQRPGDAQMSSFPTVDVKTLPSDSTLSNINPNPSWQKSDPIVEPQGVYRLPNGKLVLSRECS